MIGKKPYLLALPQFTPDGRFLLLQSKEPGMLIFDAKTWKLQRTLPELPTDAIAYVPAVGTNRAIYGSKSGTVALWDAEQKREIATLDHDARIHRAAFSPDSGFVAVATVHQVGKYWMAYRLGIWSTKTGELLHQLRPFEHNECGAIEGLLWSMDGRYLLAAVRGDAYWTSRQIGIWSLKTGRHRGNLSGCPTDVTGVVLLDDGRLIAGCSDGKIRVWDTVTALKEVDAFEAAIQAAASAHRNDE